MAFKTITIKEGVYNDLIKAKPADESFSEFFGRLIEEKAPNLLDFYGAWKLKKGEDVSIRIALEKERAKLESDWDDRIKRVLL